MLRKKPPTPSAKLRQILTKPCPTCGGIGWVCEVHTLRAFGHNGCGDPGVPCRCNPEALALFDED